MVSVPNSTNINPFNYTNTANLTADNYVSTNNLNSNQLLNLQGNKYQNQHYLNQNNSTWSNSSNQFKAQLNTYYKNDMSNPTQSNKPLNYHFEIGSSQYINQNDQYLNKTSWNESFTKFNYEIQLAAKPAVKKGTIDYSSYDLNSGKIALKQDGQKNFKRNSHISKLSNSKKTRTKDKYRVVYNETQRFELESEFFKSKYITSRRKTELASFLDLSQRQIKIWFQNRRAKDRKISKKKRNEVTTSYSDNSSKNSSLSDSDLNMNHVNLYNNNPEYNTNWQQHGQFSNNINIQKVEMLTQPTNLHISSTVNDYKFNPISDDYNKNWF